MTTEKAPKKKTISKESALAQIETLLDYYGIDKEDIEIMDGTEAVQSMYNTLVRAIMRGVLEINTESGEFVMTHHLTMPVRLQSGDINEIIYTDKVAEAKIAVDSINPSKANQRSNQFLATMGNVTLPIISKLRGFDETVKSRISVVFSMV